MFIVRAITLMMVVVLSCLLVGCGSSVSIEEALSHAKTHADYSDFENTVPRFNPTTIAQEPLSKSDYNDIRSTWERNASMAQVLPWLDRVAYTPSSVLITLSEDTTGRGMMMVLDTETNTVLVLIAILDEGKGVRG